MNKRSSRIVQVERLRDQVFRIILDEMRSGDITPGQRLYEVELAEKYGVSRTPIREALFQLAREGLLVEAERGYIFPKATRQDTRDRLEMRLLLDSAIARRAATEGSEEQIAELGRALGRERASLKDKSPTQFIEANADFRLTLRSMCANKLMTKCAEQISDQLFLHSTRAAIFHEPANREKTVRDHQRIFEAIKARQPDRAEEAARQFLLRVMTYYFDNHPPEDGE